ncbi:hypothetical protein BLNAU_16866 [Blattamonas nauphoetae]|uniref:Uncharacterized protein n=1 Tax=Blattamonas nauphoetae TaxID=2049346 RepID=A0ABQ9X804_9EUKA|nr:hypothetical protein BLNAU_19804 [Blattamonas nauphoetae]KAK2948157.1 hypothetical protein BLNAU_16866 [Blattamonas nauphoetae]
MDHSHRHCPAERTLPIPNSPATDDPFHSFLVKLPSHPSFADKGNHIVLAFISVDLAAHFTCIHLNTSANPIASHPSRPQPLPNPNPLHSAVFSLRKLNGSRLSPTESEIIDGEAPGTKTPLLSLERKRLNSSVHTQPTEGDHSQQEDRILPIWNTDSSGTKKAKIDLLVIRL